MQHAVRRVFSKYATFSGRASRPEFWWWILAVTLILIVTQLIDAYAIAPALGIEPFGPDAGQPLSAIVSLGLILPQIAVSVRRLHDINKSGWWLLMALVPLVGALVLLYFYVQPSDAERNGFGDPDPLPV